jgi:hypothetical protein
MTGRAQFGLALLIVFIVGSPLWLGVVSYIRQFCPAIHIDTREGDALAARVQTEGALPVREIGKGDWQALCMVPAYADWDPVRKAVGAVEEPACSKAEGVWALLLRAPNRPPLLIRVWAGAAETPLRDAVSCWKVNAGSRLIGKKDSYGNLIMEVEENPQ